MEKITIDIATDGTPTIKVNGVKGRSCQDATRELEQALGKTVSDKATSEMYEQPQGIQNRNKS